ncbi:MAG TPA: von Willebrand factor type A domain-containing protein [Kofleriaceae bacterium]|nr:von Willebrand factor type A domain-containing protein [Kofleriaceae bacterium]
MRHVRYVALCLLAACTSVSKKTAQVAAPTPDTAVAVESAPATTGAVAPTMPPPAPQIQPAQVAAADPQTQDTSTAYAINPWTETSQDRLSTFAADVDTASYTLARRTLQGNALPPAAAVRVEEFVNFFRYTFPKPEPGSPFSVVIDAAPSPLVPEHHIVRVGVATPAQGIRKKPANLVFLVDVSGSMDSADKLPLAKQSLKLLTYNLQPADSVALVTYAGNTRVVLPATTIRDGRDKILSAIDKLGAGGSTAMASGLDLAYDQAMQGVRRGAISRVIVCSDGDANVGATSHQEMLKLIESRAKAGVTLSTIGFGTGNYRDDLMEQLGDKGNGNNFYIDNLGAARKVFMEDLTATLEVAAKDAKLQVEFDPELVARYRLVGYENRNIADADFRKDEVDAGEIGVGHQVTALYEVQLTAKAKAGTPRPLATVRIRHKQPDGDTATEHAFPMRGGWATSFDVAPADFRFAFAVAAFADLLRGAEDAQRWSLADIEAVAKKTAGGDKDRLELVSLIEAAKRLRPSAAVAR